MSHLIVAEDAIGVLSMSVLPEALPAPFGGAPNPFKDLIEFLDKTRGRWNHQNETRGGRTGFVSSVSSEFGVPVPDGIVIYKSPYFTAGRLPLSIVPQALGMFAAMGLYFELVEYPCFVQLADQQYDNQTPSYLPNSRIPILDEDGEPTGDVTKVTWNNWRDTDHKHVSDNGQNYVTLNNNTGKSELAGSMLTQLVADGYNVQQMSAWPAIESEEP